VQFMPVFSRTYCNVDDLNSGLGSMEAFTEQPSLWSCHLRTFVCTISKKKEAFTLSCLQSRCGLQFVL
jgi:hypothetical protein